VKSNKKTAPINIEELSLAENKRLLDPYSIIPLIPIHPEHHVGDIGCGVGTFSIPLAKYLFAGKLYAFDTNKTTLDQITDSLKSINLNNIELKISTEDSIPLKDNVLDGVFLSLALEKSHSPKVVLNEIKRLIKQFGWLAIISSISQLNKTANKEYNHISKLKLNEMVEKLGFKRLSQRELNEKFYLSIYKCQ